MLSYGRKQSANEFSINKLVYNFNILRLFLETVMIMNSRNLRFSWQC